MAKKIKNERKLVEVEVDCETNRLYGSLDGAIAYLQEIKEQYKDTNIVLDENWTGYEDMQMRFVYTRLENDEEYEARIAQEKRLAAAHEYMRKAEEHRKKDLEELNRLKSKLGLR
jgi:hypothetical protein